MWGMGCMLSCKSIWGLPQQFKISMTDRPRRSCKYEVTPKVFQNSCPWSQFFWYFVDEGICGETKCWQLLSREDKMQSLDLNGVWRANKGLEGVRWHVGVASFLSQSIWWMRGVKGGSCLNKKIPEAACWT